jgi:hypothetical protein
LVHRKEFIMSKILRLSFAAALFVGTAVLPSAVNAQSAARDSVATDPVATDTRNVAAPTANVAGPRIVHAGYSPVASLPLSKPVQDEGVNAGSNVAMMGVGLAAIVVGSMVGGDGGTIIAISGGVIGLVGLFRYLR